MNTTINIAGTVGKLHTPWDAALSAHRARCGGREQFLDLTVRFFHEMVFGVAYRITGQSADAYDLTQEVFIKFLQKVDDLEPSSLPGWLKKTAFLMSLAWLRTNRRYRDFLQRMGALQECCLPRADDSATESIVVVQEILDLLSVEEREAVKLAFVEDCKHHQIAESLGCSVRTVGRRFREVRARIRPITEGRLVDHQAEYETKRGHALRRALAILSISLIGAWAGSRFERVRYHPSGASYSMYVSPSAATGSLADPAEAAGAESDMLFAESLGPLEPSLSNARSMLSTSVETTLVQGTDLLGSIDDASGQVQLATEAVVVLDLGGGSLDNLDTVESRSFDVGITEHDNVLLARPCKDLGCSQVNALFALDSALSMTGTPCRSSVARGLARWPARRQAGGYPLIGLSDDRDGGFISTAPWFDSREMTADEIASAFSAVSAEFGSGGTADGCNHVLSSSLAALAVDETGFLRSDALLVLDLVSTGDDVGFHDQQSFDDICGDFPFTTGDPVGFTTWLQSAIIHDFDGDGEFEMTVSAASYYSVLETDLSILWTASVGDANSWPAGTEFDFLGEGMAEAIYTDEVALYVEDGTLPQFESPSWEAINTLRTDARIEGGGLCVPVLPGEGRPE